MPEYESCCDDCLYEDITVEQCTVCGGVYCQRCRQITGGVCNECQHNGLQHEEELDVWGNPRHISAGRNLYG